MARQSSGAYQAPANTAAVSGQAISSTKYNTLTGDLGNEITNSLDRLGRGAMQADMSLGGFKITDVADPITASGAATKQYVDAADTTSNASYLPAGAIQAFAMSTAPSGWLECNGSAVSRATYSALFAALGTTWGAGDGSTTFNLPDFRGYFLRGWDHGAGVDSGRAFASAQSDQNLAHGHAVTDPGHFHHYAFNVGGVAAGGLGGGYNQDNNTDSAVTGISIQSSGGSEARPKNKAILYCIRT